MEDVREGVSGEALVHLLATEPSPANIVELESDGQHLTSEGSLVRKPGKE